LLICAGLADEGAVAEGEDHDAEIQGETPVLDVPDIVEDALLEAGVAAPAVDLRPARDARQAIVADVVVRDPLLKFIYEFGAFRTRADEAHLAFEHVPELREFIDVELAHEGADFEPARVDFLTPLGFAVFLGVQTHAADFDDLKGLAVFASADLAVKD